MNILKDKLKLSLIYVHLFPMLLFLTLETMNYSEKNNAILRALNAFPSLILSWILIYLLIVILHLITGRLFISSFVITAVLYFFYVVNFFRKHITGWVFVPTDLSFARKMKNMLDFANLNPDQRIINPLPVVLVLLVILFFAARELPKLERSRKRLAALGLALFVFGGLFFSSFSKRWIMPIFGVDVRQSFTNNQVYDRNGVIIGFYIAYAFDTMQLPKKYTEDSCLELVDSVKQQALDKISDQAKASADGKKPNVIVIMSEAFSDPSRWSNLAFSEEPIPFYKQMLEETIGGTLVTPAFAGSTCNVEYEFLTGLSYMFTGHGRIPYEEVEKYFGNEKIIAMPQIYKENGYNTVALHTYEGSFFNRDKIYPILGFDKFISSEDMKGAPIEGQYISDKYFTDRLIGELKNKRPNQPLFLFGVTMENHYDYPPNKYPKGNKIKSTSSLLNDEQQGSVDAYLHGISNADTQLKRLTEYLKGYKEPTILVFFGDHLPSLANSAFEVYTALDYLKSNDDITWSKDDFYKMYTTTYAVWTNYGNTKNSFGTISPYFLANQLLNMSQVDKPVYYHFLDTAYDAFHGMKDNLYVNHDETIHSASIAEDESVVNMFYTFQYDSIFGKNFITNKLSEILRK